MSEQELLRTALVLPPRARLLSDMKLLWVNRLSLIGKNLFRLFFLQAKL